MMFHLKDRQNPLTSLCRKFTFPYEGAELLFPLETHGLLYQHPTNFGQVSLGSDCVDCPACVVWDKILNRQPINTPSEVNDKLTTAVYVAMGEASMCWSKIGDAGEFQSVMASRIADNLLTNIRTLYNVPEPEVNPHYCYACKAYHV